MPTRQVIIDRAMQLAVGVAGDAQRSVIADAEATAELALSHAIRAAVYRLVKMPGGLEEVAKTHYIALDAAGIGTLPVEILKEFLDRSYLPSDPRASLVPLTDYSQFKFSQLCYYAIRGSEFRYSCSTPAGVSPRTLTVTDVVAGNNFVDSAGQFLTSDVGNMLTVSGDGNIAAVISSYVSPNQVAIKGRVSASGGGAAGASATIGGVSSFGVVRTFATCTLATTDTAFSSPNAGFTNLDAGRRIRITSGTKVTDTTIASIVSPTDALLNARGLNAYAAEGSAEILESGLGLHTPSMPTMPTLVTDEIDMSERLSEQTVLILAALMRGEISLAQLQEGNYA